MLRQRSREQRERVDWSPLGPSDDGACRMKAGRNVLGRAYQATAYCQSCGTRRTVGEPRTTETWYLRLRELTLNPEQLDLLLQAAAEYADLSEEAGEYESAIGFLDWVRPDALGLSLERVEHDGAPARYERGTSSAKGHLDGVHRHPFPLPQASLPPDWRRG
jgi:hypothetical protein